MKYKRKYGKSLWVDTFPEMAAKLHPERTLAGGVKARSQSEAVRMAVYHGIKELFIIQNPLCQCCEIVGKAIGESEQRVSFYRPHFADAIHHKRGRAGLLLFDVRHWLSACNSCHRYLHDNPAEAIKLGLLSKDWNKL